LTTFDRHLLSRFLHAFVVYFVAALGLYVVVDGFTNLDGFQSAAEGGTLAMLSHMARHYAFQSSLLLELVGPTAGMLSVSTTLALLSKHGEIYPLLAAGVPTYRLAVPFVLGVILVNVALVANQELVMPRISSHLQGSHGDTAEDARQVEPCYSAAGIFISGQELYLTDNRLHEAEFRLSPGPLTAEHVCLTAANAFHLPQQGNWPAGWLLKDASPKFDALRLTEVGRQIIVPQRESNDLFIKTEVTFEELYNRSTSFKFLSTAELFRRVRRPSLGTTSTRSQLLHLHSRFTRPIVMIVGVFLVLPVILRRDSWNLAANIGLCTLVLASVFGTTQALHFVSHAGMLSTELAAWAPVIGSAGLSAWLSPMIRT
jgi:lipopolysaccharide export system permease protein